MKKQTLLFLLVFISVNSIAQTWQQINLTEDTSSVSCSFYDSTTNELYLGGKFKTFNGIVANSIVKWNGSQWLPVGEGFDGNQASDFLSAGVVSAITKYKGSIIAAGTFDSSGTNGFKMPIAKWDGTQWLPLDTVTDVQNGFPNQRPWINSLAIYNNDLYAIGNMRHFEPFPGTNDFVNFAFWNDTIWQPAMQLDSYASTIYLPRLLVYNNDLYLAQVAGLDTCLNNHPPILSAGLLKYNKPCKSLEIIGNNWGNGTVKCLLEWNGILYVGFDHINSIYGSYITSYDGTNFSPLGTGLNYFVESMTVYNGQLVAAGGFTADGTNTQMLPYIATWNGITWLPFPDQCDFSNWVYDINSYDTIIIASGIFTTCDSSNMGFAAIYPSPLTGINTIKTPLNKTYVSPNPTTGNFTLQFNTQPTTGIVQLYNINSKLVLQQNIAPYSQYKHLNITNLPQGIYLCKLKWGISTASIKIIKE